MQTNSKRLLWFVNVLLTMAWYLNIGIVVFVLGILTYSFATGDHYDFDCLVKARTPSGVQVLQSTSVTVKDIVVTPDQYLFKMKVKNSSEQIFLIFVYFLLLEALIMTTLYQLRKVFGSFSRDALFAYENVRRLKITALCFLLYFPLDCLFAWSNYLILQWSGYGDQYMLVTDLSFTCIFVAIVIYIMTDVFQRGFDIQQENKEFI